MLALSLVLCNAFFVMAEFSLVRIRRTKLEELLQNGETRAKRALLMVDNLDLYISASQFGITVSSLALGWIGEPAIASILAYFFTFFTNNQLLLHTLSFSIGFSIITFMHIVVGEMLPRSIAIQLSEQIVLFTSSPLYFFHKICMPFIFIFNKSARALATLLGVKLTDTETVHSEEELRMIVTESHKGGILDKVESDIIDNVFDFVDCTAREVMIPRQDMVCLFIDDSFEKNMHTVHNTHYTRYPLCIKDRDHVIGMVHLRDLVTIDFCHTHAFDFRSIMRKIIMIPENMPISQVLQEMRLQRIHLSVVIDEYGGTAGMVTMEDVIEEIIGDIQDEHDTETEAIQLLPDNTYEIDGTVLVDDIIELLHLNIPEPDEDTIGGYVFALLGRRPEVGDIVNIDNHEFKVTKTIGFRVKSVNTSSLTIKNLTIAEESSNKETTALENDEK